MKDTAEIKAQIETQIAELCARLEAVETALDEPTNADLNDQAIELEDDEVLEAVGRASQKELVLLQQALGRIEKGTYGICHNCDEEISFARLKAVPFAILCHNCASPKKE